VEQEAFETKALQEERPETGAEVSKRLKSLKLLLWHGNTEEALERSPMRFGSNRESKAGSAPKIAESRDWPK
jgi:hypothetical protein